MRAYLPWSMYFMRFDLRVRSFEGPLKILNGHLKPLQNDQILGILATKTILLAHLLHSKENKTRQRSGES